MNGRYLTGVATVLLGGFLVVSSQAFPPTATAWLGFAIAIGLVVMVALAQLDRRRGAVQRSLDAAVVVLAIWTIISSLVFSPAVAMWLVFAEGLGFAVLAVSSLTVNELALSRAIRRRPEPAPEPALRAA
jgi:hypothetical protein